MESILKHPIRRSSINSSNSSKKSLSRKNSEKLKANILINNKENELLSKLDLNEIDLLAPSMPFETSIQLIQQKPETNIITNTKEENTSNKSNDDVKIIIKDIDDLNKTNTKPSILLNLTNNSYHENEIDVDNLILNDESFELIDESNDTLIPTAQEQKKEFKKHKVKKYNNQNVNRNINRNKKSQNTSALAASISFQSPASNMSSMSNLSVCTKTPSLSESSSTTSSTTSSESASSFMSSDISESGHLLDSSTMSPKPKKAYQAISDETSPHHQIHHAQRHHRHVHHHRNYEGHVHQHHLNESVDEPDSVSIPMITTASTNNHYIRNDVTSNSNTNNSNVNKNDLANKRSHFVRTKSDIKNCSMKVIEFNKNNDENENENIIKIEEIKLNNSIDSSSNKLLRNNINNNNNNNTSNTNLLSASSSVIHRSTPNLNNLNEIISEDLSLNADAAKTSSNAKNSLSKYEINYPSNLELSTNLDDLQQRSAIKLDNNTNNGLNNTISVLASDKSNLNSINNNKLLINNLLINNNNNIYTSNNNKKLTQRYKLIVEGDVHVCKLPNTRNVISKILNSKLLRRWKAHRLILTDTEIYSATVNL